MNPGSFFTFGVLFGLESLRFRLFGLESLRFRLFGLCYYLSRSSFRLLGRNNTCF